MWLTIALYSIIWIVGTFLLIPWVIGLIKFPQPSPPVTLILQIVATVIYVVLMYRLLR